jgi:hypothetical protein
MACYGDSFTFFFYCGHITSRAIVTVRAMTARVTMARRYFPPHLQFFLPYVRDGGALACVTPASTSPHVSMLHPVLHESCASII